MSRLGVWKRLFWKEFREGWPVLLFAVAAPPVLLGGLPNIPLLAAYKEALNVIVTVGLPAAIMVWLTKKPNERIRVGEFGTARLPISPVAEWVTSFAAPMILLGTAGAWMGMWSAVSANLGNVLLFSAAWGIFIAALYVAARFLSSVLPSWITTLCMGVWLMWVSISQVPFLGNTPADTLRTTQQAAAFNSYICAVAVVGSLLFILRGSAINLTSRVLAIGLALAVVPGPYVKPITTEIGTMTRPFDTGGMDAIFSPDDSYVIHAHPRNAPKGLAEVRFRNDRTGKLKTRLFKQEVKLIGSHGHRRVFIAQQIPHERRLRILAWDTKEDTVDVASSITTPGDSLRGHGFLAIATLFKTGGDSHILTLMMPDLLSDRSSWVSPSGDFLTLSLKSTAGIGYDLWIVDLRKRKSVMVLPNSLYARQEAVWTDRRMILSGLNNIVTVDLDTMKAEVRDIPFDEGEHE